MGKYDGMDLVIGVRIICEVKERCKVLKVLGVFVRVLG